MKRYFLDAAQSEFDAAIDNYDEQRFGLGIEFEEEVEQALERIDNYPEAWSLVPSTPLSPQSISLQCDLRASKRKHYDCRYPTSSSKARELAIQNN
jgi:hypothetical protein